MISINYLCYGPESRRHSDFVLRYFLCLALKYQAINKCNVDYKVIHVAFMVLWELMVSNNAAKADNILQDVGEINVHCRGSQNCACM